MKTAKVQGDKTVTCPHCGHRFGGNAVDDTARQGRSMKCQQCGKSFRPILPKKKK